MAGNEFRVDVVVKYDNLPKISAVMRVEAGRISKEIATKIRDEVAIAAPIGDRSYTDADGHSHPGWLGDSVIVQRNPDRRTTLQWQCVVTATYGPFVEYGYHEWKSGNWVPPQPFFNPVVALNLPVFTKKMEEMLATIEHRVK